MLSKSVNFDNKLISFNRKIASNTTKYVEVHKKLNSIITKDYNFFSDRIYFRSNDGSQTMFVYQATLDMLGLKKDKGADHFLSCKSKGVYNSKLEPLYTAFLHIIKLFGDRMGIKFDKDPLNVEQSNYLCTIVNAFIVYDLDAWFILSMI